MTSGPRGMMTSWLRPLGSTVLIIVVLEEHFSGSTEDTRVFTTLSHNSRSSDYRPEQAVVVAKAGGVNTFSNRDQLQVHGSQG